MKEIKNFHKQILESDYLNSYNFARKSNKVFGETIAPNQFKKLNLINDSYEIYQFNDDYLTYRLKKLIIEDGDIIFCKTDFIFELFSILFKVSKKINISLITHQADQPSVDRSLFLMKPKCIQNWYAINVDYQHPNLIPIPLGIANNYSPKTLNISDFKKNVQKLDFQKKRLAYLNFSIDTNIPKRKKIAKEYQSIAWVKKNSDISKQTYMTEVANTKFIFSPPGMGIDTHRFWEALYLGTVPIAEYNINNSMFNMYPILFYNDNKLLSESHLINSYDNLVKSFEIKKLTISWWFDNIIKKAISSSGKVIILEYKYINKLLKKVLKIKYKYLKKINH